VSGGARSTLAWGALLLLTATSFGVSHLQLGHAAVPIALGIAVVKACVVLLVFMELREEPVSARIAFAAGALMVALLVVFVVADVETRAPAPLPPPPVGRG